MLRNSSYLYNDYEWNALYQQENISAESMSTRASWRRPAGQVWPAAAGQGMRDAGLDL